MTTTRNFRGSYNANSAHALFNATSEHRHNPNDSLSAKNESFVTLIGDIRFRQHKYDELARVHGSETAILTAWKDLDTGFLQHVMGQYALAIVDLEKRLVLLANDRFSSFQIAYAFCPERGLVFGNDVADVATRAKTTEINSQAIFNYIYFHVIPSPVSIFRNVNKLPPASYILFAGETVDPVLHWTPEFNPTNNSIEDCKTQLHTLLASAVSQPSPDPGGVACFLSGGLDSSSIAGTVATSNADRTQAYSIGFDAEGYDEMQYSEAVAEHFGIDLNSFYLNPQHIVELMPQIAAALGEPFGNSSAVPTLLCAKQAANAGVKTMLAGDGGDEIFAGNERYKYQQLFRYYEMLPAFMRRGMLEPISRRFETHSMSGLPRKILRYIEQAATPLPDRLESYNFLHVNPAEEIFNANFLADVDITAPLAAKRRRYHETTADTSLQRMLYLDWKFTLADNDLRKVGNMCALAGVDVRYPLLDDEIVDLSLTLPPDWLIKDGDLRHFFRYSVSDFLPEKTLKKSKHGFGLPFGVWLRTHAPLKELMTESIASLKRRQIFRDEFITQVLADHESKHASYFGEMIWIMMMLELWLQAH